MAEQQSKEARAKQRIWDGPDAQFVEWTLALLKKENVYGADFDEWDGLKSLIGQPFAAKEKHEFDRESSLEAALAFAYHGDMTWLRQLYPEIAEYIHHPAGSKGSGWPKSRKVGKILWREELDKGVPATAADIARYIPQMWQREFGKVKRPSGSTMPKQIAIEYCRRRGHPLAANALRRPKRKPKKK